MSKIFRIYSGGTDTYQGWNDNPSFPYNSTSRATIEDPDGASAKNEITSIPSPFARIDLVKTAFKEVAKTAQSLDGNTIYHKMVSDTLDVAEIFFNIDKYKNKIEIIKWDPTLMIQELKDSDSSGHRYLADSLEKYLLSDAKTYNFEQLQNIYLLNYINGPDELNIIGATSPATLFFSNANDLSFVNDIYFSDNDIPFDREFQPLYKRDFEFVKYLFTLRKTIPRFANIFPEVDAYLALTYNAITDTNKKQELRDIDNNTLDQFETITAEELQQSNNVEVLGHLLYRKKLGSVDDSEFTINSQIYQGKAPLVLPVDGGNKYQNLKYTTGKWGNTNCAPYVDDKILTSRVLPFDGSLYPYLTISDFLEDNLVRVPHDLNKNHYFDGRIDKHETELSYLIPLKSKFFEFFSIEELMENMPDGKPMFEMQTRAPQSIKVYLRIPIKGNSNIKYIEYSRIYYCDSDPDISRNRGAIIEFNFTGFIMPLVKFNNAQDAIYNIACVNGVSHNYSFDFYTQNTITPSTTATRNVDRVTSHIATNYLIEHNNFDYIKISNTNHQSGLIIPKFKQHRNIDVFEFSIDLGTTNTHIEYRKNNESIKTFKIEESDIQPCAFFVRSIDDNGIEYGLANEIQIIEKDYLPNIIGDNDFKFPTRTVLSAAKTVDWKNHVKPFMLANIPFTYHKREPLAYNYPHCNIKWGKGDEQAIMDTYVRCLMLLIRNKVLLNNGDLSQTKVTWFYPISMAPVRRSYLQQAWDSAYNLYFGQGSTKRLTESEAPIRYFFNRYGTVTDLVSVDIGGGTTDIAFAKDKQIKAITSFKFATNQLFEDPFGENDNNGIIDFFKERFKNLFIERNLNELIAIFDDEDNRHPANMASFLFNLKDNSIIQRNNLNNNSIDFNNILKNDENFKIVFILFYTSIIYHIAQIIKNLNLPLPRHIAFSGNGSKIINVITPDLSILSKYTKLIFEKTLGQEYGKELEIIGLDAQSSPKESTCKGGLIAGTSQDNTNKIIVLKSDCTGITDNKDTYDKIDDNYKSKCVKAVEDFFDFALLTMNETFNFNNNFGVTRESMEIAMKICKNDLHTFLDRGIAQKLEEIENTDKIEETFFFYPIKGVINQISSEIYDFLTTNHQNIK